MADPEQVLVLRRVRGIELLRVQPCGGGIHLEFGHDLSHARYTFAANTDFTKKDIRDNAEKG